MGQAGPVYNKYFHPGSESYHTKIIFEPKVYFCFLEGRGVRSKEQEKMPKRQRMMGSC